MRCAARRGAALIYANCPQISRHFVNDGTCMQVGGQMANYLTQMLSNSLDDISAPSTHTQRDTQTSIRKEPRFGYLSLSRLFHLNNK